MKKKIGILTQPLMNNYGGILQAYALTQTLHMLGYHAEIIRREHDTKRLLKVKNIIKKILFNKKTWDQMYYDLAINMLKFVQDNIKQSEKEYYSHNIHDINNNQYDAIIVGSDQVWRPKYSPKITNYFLDFCRHKNIKKISYSASFGSQEWEFSPKETSQCAKLIKEFHAISVREKSAVHYCKEYFGLEYVRHTLDPTFLLNREHYIKLIHKYNEPKHDGDLMYYILDNTPDKQSIIREISNVYSLKSFSIMPEKNLSTLLDYHNDEHTMFAYPRVTSWLRGFLDAQYVITDSFHGTVFSIIFNKPFFVIANKERGLARFYSLLEMFNLTNRLIFSLNDLKHGMMLYEFDWDTINSTLIEKKKKSIVFLKEALENNDNINYSSTL